MALVPADDWREMIDFYRRFVHEHRWPLEPMLEFVSWLANSEYSAVLFPSTSVDALGLSTVATFQERLRIPMVYIAYVDRDRTFTIHYQRGQGNDDHRETTAAPHTPEVFRRILTWLGVPLPP
jgi:hypothetical protein